MGAHYHSKWRVLDVTLETSCVYIHLHPQLANLVRALESKQSSEAPGKFEDFGSQLAQLRERLNELDRAVTALSDHLANLSHHDMEAVTDTDGEKFVDMNSFNVVQGLLAQLQQEHERLMGTAAHLSHELDITKDHVKVRT